MPYADNNGVRIYYQVEGNGPPLVLQHWSTSSIQGWYRNGYVEPLKSDYQLILVDSRGHGQSDKPHDSPSYALPRRVSDVVAVLDDLGIEKAHYYGYSMGGWIGFGMAKHAPERVRTFIIGGAHPYARSAEAFQGVDGTDPEAFIAALEAVAGNPLTPETKAELLANDLQALVAAMNDRDSIEDVILTMTMPCLLYVGEADARLPKVQACVKSMPNASFVSLPELDHAQGYIRSDLVLPHVMKFLQENS